MTRLNHESEGVRMGNPIPVDSASFRTVHGPYANLNEAQSDQWVSSSKNDQKNDQKFTWGQALKNAWKGIWDEGKAMVDAIVKHPLQSLVAMGTITGLILAAPLVGVSAAAMGTFLMVGTTALGVGTMGFGAVKAMASYSSGNRDQAEEDFKLIGKGMFGVLSNVIPAGIGKSVEIVANSRLGSFLANNKHVVMILKPLQGPVNAVKNMLFGATEAISETKAFQSVAASYGNATKSPFATRLASSTPVRAINDLHATFSGISDDLTVKGVKLLNAHMDDWAPRWVYISDTHSKLDALKAVAAQNPRGKNLIINGDWGNKTVHSNAKLNPANSRDINKYIINDLPEAVLLDGNHEAGLWWTTIDDLDTYKSLDAQGKLGTQYLDQPTLQEIIDAKNEAFETFLTKPSCQGFDSVLVPYRVDGKGLSGAGRQIFDEAAALRSKKNLTSEEKLLLKLADKINPDNVADLEKLAASRLYVEFGNAGGNAERGWARFMAKYYPDSSALPSEVIAQHLDGLSDLSGDFITLRARTKATHVIDLPNGEQILVDHAGAPWISVDGETRLLASQAARCEQLTAQNRYAEMNAKKHLSTFYGGEDKVYKELWFDRPDMTVEKIDAFLAEYNRLTGSNIKRVMIGHEYRGWGRGIQQNDRGEFLFPHFAKNMDGVTIQNGRIVDAGPAYNPVVTAYKGRLICADTCVGNPMDIETGLAAANAKQAFGSDGVKIKMPDGQEYQPNVWSKGAGVRVEDDGRLRILDVDHVNDHDVRHIPSDYLGGEKMLRDDLMRRLKANPALDEAFRKELSAYNQQNNVVVSLPEFIDETLARWTELGKADGRLRVLLRERFPDANIDIKTLSPFEYMRDIVRNNSLRGGNVPEIKAGIRIDLGEGGIQSLKDTLSIPGSPFKHVEVVDDNTVILTLRKSPKAGGDVNPMKDAQIMLKVNDYAGMNEFSHASFPGAFSTLTQSPDSENGERV